MFCDNLSAFLHQVCKANHLSHADISEQCGVSSCTIGRIIRKEVVPSIAVLEKLCIGLHCSPDELLGFANIKQGFIFRTPMRVTALYLLRDKFGYPICPRCGSPLDREYQAYCDRCGQYLSWERYGVDTIVITTP